MHIWQKRHKGNNHIRTLYEFGCLGRVFESNQEALNRFAEQYPDV
jgi:hypothetical protein